MYVRTYYGRGAHLALPYVRQWPLRTLHREAGRDVPAITEKKDEEENEEEEEEEERRLTREKRERASRETRSLTFHVTFER